MNGTARYHLGAMSREPIVFTIGHGRRESSELLDVLRSANVRTLVDVRLRPGSRRFPHFAAGALRDALAERGVAYVAEGAALGGHRVPSPGCRHSALEGGAFQGYAEHMETAAFRAAAGRVLELARERPTAVLCAEHFPVDCHRSLLADWFQVHGATVVHLIEKDRRDPHPLHAALRVDQGRLVYDGGRGHQLAFGW